jgi:predicted O-methyltransferase YrrM
MNLISSEIEAYMAAHSSPEPEYLARLRRETYLKVLYPRMLSGHLQGRLLAMISRILQPRLILEVGTFTGYACICLAEGLSPDGKIITLEKDPELEIYIRQGLLDAGISDRVELRFGDAASLLPDLPGPFDLVFLDADKQNYPLYYDLLIPRLKPGGMILADNVLWGGLVADETQSSKEIDGIRQFNARVAEDQRVEKLMLPMRDGILMIRKKI